MRLASFRIKNFKSIVDTGECLLSLRDNILVLAGQNEAGKSSVIEALDFFNNGPSEAFERLQRRQDDSPEVTCGFTLSNEEIEELNLVSQNNELGKYLKKNPTLTFVRGSTEEDNIDEIFFEEDCLEEIQKFFPEEVVEPTSKTEQEEDEDAHIIKTVKDLENYMVERMREFILFDTFDKYLPGVVTIQDLKKYPAATDFQKVFHIDFLTVAQKETRAIGREELRINTHASDDLNKYWSQRLDEGGQYNFRIKIIPRDPVETSEIEFKIDRSDGDPLFVEQKSKGFRWFSAFNLRLRSLGVEESTISNLVILIDEPGQGLHETAQADVKKVIEELASKGAQIIYTTHKPQLIGTEGKEFARIRIVSNSAEEGTKVETVAQYASRPGKKSVDALTPIINAMGVHSIASVIDPKRLNIVVEGISDHYYFCAFKKLLEKSSDIYFIPSHGVNKIPTLISVLIGWGCNYKAIFDDDSGSGKTAYKLLRDKFYEKSDEEAHKHILRIKQCAGIEDIFSPKDFQKLVLVEKSEDGSKANSILANGKKEVLARMFLEKVESGEITKKDLSSDTIARIEAVFKWIYETFAISSRTVQDN